MTVQANSKNKVVGTKKISNDEFMAAAIGDVQWLKQSLKERKGEISFDKNGLAPIHLAAIHGRLECLRLLLETYDVDVNLASSTGWRPIHLCVSAQTGKRAENSLIYLLEKGADPSVVNEDGVTPVHQAASEGHVRCLKLLIELGARIDVRDCRGHLPIDLAKLWGHRNCARILATEMWHREKDHVAKEMRQLKKQRMREVLDQLEHAEELAEEEKFYGKEAFQDWLRDVKERSAARQKAQKAVPVQIKRAPSRGEKEKGRRVEPKGLRVKKPTPQPQPQPAPPMKLRSRPVDPHRVLVASRDHLLPSASSPSLREVPTPATTGQEEEGATRDPKSVRPIDRPPYWNAYPWNKSNHAPETFNAYQPHLRDAYPRDPFSCQPHPRLSAPPELNVNAEEPLAVLEGESDQALLQSLADRNRTLRQRHRKMDQVSMARPGPVVYKCKNIIDVQTKRLWDRESLPRAEAVLHICDDTQSSLFQAALQRPDLEPSCTERRTSALSSISQWDVWPVASDEVRHAFVRMARATHFPNTKGREYTLNLGDLGGVA